MKIESLKKSLNLRWKLTLFLACLVLLIIPAFVGTYILMFLFLLFTYLILAESYDIVGGYIGYINLGHASFFGVGAYGFALSSSAGLPLPLSFFSATILAVVFAGAMSYPFFKLRGAYFAVATFGLLQLLYWITTNLFWLTGGSKGISIAIPAGVAMIPSYYASLAIALVCIWASYKISKIKLGLALSSIKEEEEVAEHFGINAYRYKTQALMISAAFAGIMGAVYMFNIGYINPSAVFGLDIALAPITMAMLGGSGVYSGPVIGAIILMIVQEVLWVRMPYFHLLTYGVILVLVGVFMPAGIVMTKKYKNLVKKLKV